MKLLTSLVSVCIICSFNPAVANNFVATAEMMPRGQAAITHQLNSLGTTFLNTDSINLSFDLQIAKEDIGIKSALYLVAKTKNANYLRDSKNNWQLWDNQSLIPAKELTLSEKEHLDVISNQNLPVGEYQVYAAYKTAKNEIHYNQNPVTLIVFADNSPALHLIKNPEILHDYLYQGAINSVTNYYSYPEDLVLGISAPVTTEAAVTSFSTASSTSTTNLQESGVDESDRIKTDKEHLFSLTSCGNDNSQTCLNSYLLQTSPAQSTLLDSLQLSNENTPFNNNLGELYLTSKTDSTPRSLIWLRNLNSPQIYSIKPNDWQTQQTEIQLKFINANEIEKLTVTQQLTIEGRLMTSRLVDGILYILSQKSSYYALAYNKEAISTKPPLDFFLPHYQFNNAPAISLDTNRCYLPAKNSQQYNAATLSIITAIPINNPTQYQSLCVAGELETFYASTSALYFASSRYPYTTQGNQLIYNPVQEQVTDIHKFSLLTANMDYRGSGQVTGHLGWEQDKKSFRLGEYENTLRVATSAGSNWGMDSRTKITVLEEDSATQSLKEISSIDNLGKPGERLYAARFVGKRGYLVTFRVTDPLIVIDFSQPQSPHVLGELEIAGYSDYLQVVGDNYLLGIGKDAIANPNQEGAWYQGVKVALFDVSSAEKLGEINSIVLGKRGTEATVLSDHHGLAWLAIDDNHYKLALPIELHDTFNKPYEGQNYDNPLAFYNWTHTGLYVFDIDTHTPALKLEGKLITESNTSINTETNDYNFSADRAVIQGQSVHYIHGNQVISSEIEDLKN